MLKNFFIALVLFIIIVIGYSYTQPDDFKIERSTTISAPPNKIFDLINSFKKWDSWSPWAKMDPNAINTYDGPESGVGAKMSWQGNNDVGTGSMTIVESTPNSLINIKLEFTKPMEATNMSTFTLSAVESGTSVNWAMTGKHNFVGKIFNIFMSMDKMVGREFDKGLAQIKVIAETP